MVDRDKPSFDLKVVGLGIVHVYRGTASFHLENQLLGEVLCKAPQVKVLRNHYYSVQPHRIMAFVPVSSIKHNIARMSTDSLRRKCLGSRIERLFNG